MEDIPSVEPLFEIDDNMTNYFVWHDSMCPYKDCERCLSVTWNDVHDNFESYTNTDVTLDGVSVLHKGRKLVLSAHEARGILDVLRKKLIALLLSDYNIDGKSALDEWVQTVQPIRPDQPDQPDQPDGYVLATKGVPGLADSNIMIKGGVSKFTGTYRAKMLPSDAAMIELYKRGPFMIIMADDHSHDVSCTGTYTEGDMCINWVQCSQATSLYFNDYFATDGLIYQGRLSDYDHFDDYDEDTKHYIFNWEPFEIHMVEDNPYPDMKDIGLYAYITIRDTVTGQTIRDGRSFSFYNKEETVMYYNDTYLVIESTNHHYDSYIAILKKENGKLVKLDMSHL